MKKLLGALSIVFSLTFSQSHFFIDDNPMLENYLNYIKVNTQTNLKTDIYPLNQDQLNLFLRSDKGKNVELERLVKQKVESNSNVLDSYTNLNHYIASNNDSIQYLFRSKLSNQTYLLLSGGFELEALRSGSTSGSIVSPFYRLSGQYQNFHFNIFKQNYVLSNNSLPALSKTLTARSYTANGVKFSSILDISSGYLAYKNERLTFFLGKIPWRVGFGESGKFVLNGQQTAVPTSIGLNLDFNWFRYQSIHSSLTSSELLIDTTITSANITSSYRNSPDKYLVSHRFEVDLSENFTIHYNEMIVYGNRSIDLNYLNPFSFLRPIEHELGDRDNALISLGFKWHFPKYHLLTYHDFLLDEWRISEVSKYLDSKDQWFGNKQGMLNGITWAANSFQVWFEHVSIAPYVYSHKFDANRYTHDAQALGYLAGPNSQTFFYKLTYFTSPFLYFGLSHRLEHHGKNFNSENTNEWNIGGDIFHGDNTRFKDTRRFLEGILETKKQTTFNMIYQYNYYLTTKLEFEYNWESSNIFRFYIGMTL